MRKNSLVWPTAPRLDQIDPTTPTASCRVVSRAPHCTLEPRLPRAWRCSSLELFKFATEKLDTLDEYEMRGKAYAMLAGLCVLFPGPPPLPRER